MPRKQDPNDVIDQFQAAASTSLELWTRMQGALPKSSLDLRKVASRDAFVRVAVEWERFRSHWHIAAINRDSSLYRNSVTKRLRNSVKGGKFSQLEPYLHLALPPQLSVSTVQTVLDPLGRNISFGDSWTDCGQLRRNTDRTTAHHLAQLAFAVALLLTAKLIDWRNRWSPTTAPIR